MYIMMSTSKEWLGFTLIDIGYTIVVFHHFLVAHIGNQRDFLLVAGEDQKWMLNVVNP